MKRTVKTITLWSALVITSVAAPIFIVIPWDVAPLMTASVAPGAQTTNELIRFSKTITVTDLDTFKDTDTDTTFTVYLGPIDVTPTLTSGSATTYLSTLTSSNTNTGQFVYTVSHIAKDIEGTGQITFVDEYLVEDKGKPPLKDASITLQQQVTIQGL